MTTKKRETQSASRFKLPTLKKVLDAKVDDILKKGMDILSSEPKDLTHLKTESEPARTVAQAKEGDAVQEAKKAGKEKRKDFRLNDQIPFIWTVVSKETFQNECLPYFALHREFGSRRRIQEQQQILGKLETALKTLLRGRSKSAKNMEDIRDHLSWLFLRAPSELDEEYFEGMTALLLRIAQLLAVPLGRTELSVTQMISHLKSQLDYQRVRDQSDPVTEAKRIALAEENLVNLHRKSEKITAKVEPNFPELAEKCKLFQELATAINLTQMDQPVGRTPDGKDLFPVNMSATGIAFRTRRLNIQKGDFLEMRLFLDTGSEQLDPVDCFGKVVSVQGPVEQRLKIAVHIEPMPQSFQEKIASHLTIRQRKQLAEKAAKGE